MAAPVILRPQSVLEYLQHQSWEFQPYATNSPTYWNASPLPTGLVFDTATGQISGAATFPGVYEFALVAGNGDGASTPEVFTAGIEATTALPSIDAVDLSVDLATGEVSAETPALRGVTRLVAGAPVDVKPLFWLKRGDVRMLHVRFLKGGIVADIDLATLKLTLKAYEPETALVASTTFIRCDTGANTFYRMAVTVAGNALNGALGNAEDDFDTAFAAVAELEWTQENILEPTYGPEELRSSSLNFDVGVARDLTA